MDRKERKVRKQIIGKGAKRERESREGRNRRTMRVKGEGRKRK